MHAKTITELTADFNHQLAELTQRIEELVKQGNHKDREIERLHGILDELETAVQGLTEKAK